MKGKLITLIFINTIFCSRIYSQNLENTNSSFDLPSLTIVNSKGKETYSDVTGLITKIIKNKDGKYLIFVRTKNIYYIKNNEQTEEYDLIYGNLNKLLVKNNETIKHGTIIGSCDPNCFVTSSFKKLSPFPIRISQKKAVKFDNFYFFTPDWLDKKNTNTLSYRSIPSLKDFLSNYFKRWKNENQDKSDFTIFHTNLIDRIKFKISLTRYPIEAKVTEGLKRTEEQIYHIPNLFYTENTINEYKIYGYTPVIFWQKNFDKYLKEEYKLNSPLFIYANVTTIDHLNKRIYICARDFTLLDDEKIISDRIAEYNNE
ncbi:hypothetical protein [Leptospira bouyouniensis]|uniref:hypothetical protein n=1 Tax=Leptospira bouyouniensis TaxID=2484911 RepID=UPI00109158B2|nr:hypothetical protein [Leptospira bouyouniensis]TGM74343.1 hypothetical protein EHQ99_19170 [Leptospira bouyouniensis]